MAAKRKLVSAVGAVLVHVAILSWVASSPRVQEPLNEPVVVEVIDLTKPGQGPLAMRAQASSPGAAVEGPPDEPPPVPDPAPAARPRRPTPPSANPTTEAPRSEEEQSAEELPDEADVTLPVPSVPEVPARRRVDRRESALASAGGRGGSRGRTGRLGAFDFSSYGTEIVRLTKAEIDRNPVRGIGRRDSIRVLLMVLPDGGLAWTRPGRFGYAQVLATSLGPLRTRAVLKRILHASDRFPAHPSGFRRRHYVVEVTVNFRDLPS